MEQRVAIVTGANRGLGLETCRQLAKKGILPLLTSRDGKKGRAAADRLGKDGLKVLYHPLDVTKSESIETLRGFVEREIKRVDILVNNAGVMLEAREGWDFTQASAFRLNIEVLRSTMETNVYGAFRVCQAFIPVMMKAGYGRVVNVSSGMGQLSSMNGGWAAYRISKAALNAVTRVFASEAASGGVLVNSASPGWVKTDMGGPEGELEVEEGVETIVWLATLPQNGPTGGFFEDRKPIDW